MNIKYIKQLDLIKGFAILSVIVLHTIPIEYLGTIHAQLYIWQAVPVFFIISGITLVISSSQKSHMTFKDFYIQNLISRIKRIVLPFLVIFVISLAYGIYTHKAYIGVLNIIGYLPVSGDGNYFVTILLQYIILAPIIVRVFNKHPYVTIIGLFAVDLSFELIAPYIPVFTSVPYLYSGCILRYTSAIALGMYAGNEYLKNKSVNIKNPFILTGFAISLVFLVALSFFHFRIPMFRPEWAVQSIISFFYPAIAVILLLNWNYETKISVLQTIGKASYHIFLVQIIFFGFGLSLQKLIPTQSFALLGIPAIIGNLIITVLIGYLFYRAEVYIRSIRKAPTAVQ